MEKIAKPKLRPVLDTLESAIKIWFKNLKKIVFLYLWGLLFALIPVAIYYCLFSVLDFFFKWDIHDLGLLFFPVIISYLVISFLFFYFSVRSYMSIFLLVKKNYEGKTLTIYKETKKLFWPFVGLTFLTTIFIFLWALLFVIPGVIYLVFCSFAVYVFFFEDEKGMAAIRRSISLVKNYWWEIFGRYLFIGLIFFLFVGVISTPLYLFKENPLFLQFWNGIIQAANFLVGPIVLFYSYQIYQDLIKIKK